MSSAGLAASEPIPPSVSRHPVFHLCIAACLQVERILRCLSIFAYLRLASSRSRLSWWPVVFLCYVLAHTHCYTDTFHGDSVIYHLLVGISISKLHTDTSWPRLTFSDRCLIPHSQL